MDYSAMSYTEFLAYMEQRLAAFKKTVEEEEDYSFAREEGGTMALGDWFEQFGCQSGLM